MKSNYASIINKTASLFALFIFLTNTDIKGQNRQFSFTQYMNNLTPVNQAYSVLPQGGSLDLVARKQWAGIDGAPTSFLINGSFPIANINAAAGLTILNDQFAIEHNTEINAFFAKAVKLSQNGYLAVSLNVGIRNYIANYSSLDASDPEFRDDIRETKPNLGFGLIFFTNWYYLGLSVPQLTFISLGTGSVQENINFRNHYYFSGALIMKVSDGIMFKPAALVSYSRGVPLIADVSGTLYLQKEFGIGLNFRTNNELAGIFSVNLNTFRIGYSYQFGTASNNFGGFNNATQEISLSFRFGKNGDNRLL